jgi:hypothetical protein
MKEISEEWQVYADQGVTKRCLLSWLTNSVLVYEPNCGEAGDCGVSTNEYSVWQLMSKSQLSWVSIPASSRTVESEGQQMKQC